LEDEELVLSQIVAWVAEVEGDPGFHLAAEVVVGTVAAVAVAVAAVGVSLPRASQQSTTDYLGQLPDRLENQG
jgi:hypothetical protein